MRITVIATGIEPAPATTQTNSGATVTTLPPKARQEAAAPAPQPTFRPAPQRSAVPPEVPRQSNSLYSGYDEQDRSIPTYLRIKERMQAQQAARMHNPGTEDFTFEDESEVPTFIRRQAN